MTIREQAMLFAEAKEIVGVKGAALTNTIFCQASTAVMVLSPSDFPDPFFWDICGQRNVRYGELFGPIASRGPQGMNNFTIEPNRLRYMLSKCGEDYGLA